LPFCFLNECECLLGLSCFGFGRFPYPTLSAMVDPRSSARRSSRVFAIFKDQLEMFSGMLVANALYFGRIRDARALPDISIS
jgi:hypothetical protein